MDYRALLLKYMIHVADCEGSADLDNLELSISSVEFTPVELMELRAIEEKTKEIAP